MDGIGVLTFSSALGAQVLLDSVVHYDQLRLERES